MTEAGEIEAPRYERALGGLGLGTAVVAATTTTTTATDDGRERSVADRWR